MTKKRNKYDEKPLLYIKVAILKVDTRIFYG